MKINGNNGNFEPCPEYNGRAVCVDVTPLRKQQTQFGERDVFKVVFETELPKQDGARFCVWSKNFTPSLNEKANFRKFLRGWFGRDLTEEELADFDTETLLGRAAQLVVIHEHKDGQTYANIMACVPDKSAEPLKASGKFVRTKDRQGLTSAIRSERTSRTGKDTQSDTTHDNGQHDPFQEECFAATRVHVGRCKGIEVRQLTEEQATALIEHWVPLVNGNPSDADKRLIAALEWWERTMPF